MAQFDVYKNPSPSTKKLYPYLVDIQNSLISDIATRIVVPLGRLSYFRNQTMKGLTPEITFNNDKLVLLTPQIAAIPADLLKAPIGSLSHLRHEIISSLDFAITGV